MKSNQQKHQELKPTWTEVKPVYVRAVISEKEKKAQEIYNEIHKDDELAEW